MIRVREAIRADAALILGFIRGLADYERLPHEVTASEADIEAALFSPHPRAFCDIAEQDGAAVGFAFWFYNFSTFEGRCGVYLEDLFVVPEARGSGAGLALMRRLARRCRRGPAPARMAGARLERADHRLLRPARRDREDRMDHALALRPRAGGAG
jgi:GNAT superfamily N-acetyltransferase